MIDLSSVNRSNPCALAEEEGPCLAMTRILPVCVLYTLAHEVYIQGGLIQGNTINIHIPDTRYPNKLSLL